MSKFYYCQSQIEGNSWCTNQCDHCKEYYAPLEKRNAEEDKLDKSKKSKKYYLHRKIREQGYTIIAHDRTILVPYTQDTFSKQVLRLRDEFGYSIQTEII